MGEAAGAGEDGPRHAATATPGKDFYEDARSLAPSIESVSI